MQQFLRFTAFLGCFFGLQMAAHSQLPVISNGGFESGFAGWTRADQIGSEGAFVLQTGTISPVNGDPVTEPPQGTRAAMTDAGGPGSHVLYQDFIATGSSGLLRFALFLGNRADRYATPATLDFATPALNQQARVDILRAGADPFSVAAADILLTLYRTQVGDPLINGYFTVTSDIGALLAAHPGEVLRLRFAETDNINSFQLGVDNIRIEAATPVYYSKAAGDLHNVLTWGINLDGSGANPSDFGTGKYFQLANRPGIYTMTGNWMVGGILNIPASSQLQIAGNSLSLTDKEGPGTISGSNTSNLTIIGTDGGNIVLNFTPGSNMLNNLTVNRSGANAAATLGNALNVVNVLTLTTGTLNTAGQLTLKSTATNTARVAPITGAINGDVTVERYIPMRRAWRILSAPVGGVTDAAIGQATLSHSQETVQGTFARPLSYGTSTFSLNAARTALTFTATIYNIDVTGSQTPGDNSDNLAAAHIHVGAPPGVNAPVRWGFFGTPDNDVSPKNTTLTPFAFGVGGTFTGTWDLPEGAAGTTLTTNLPEILAGRSYINFHTVQFGGGEIRGQINMVGASTQTVNQAWQEGTILGLSANPNPFPGFGTHITGGPLYGTGANGFDQNPVGAMSSIKEYIANTWTPLPNTNATPVGGRAYMTFVRGNRALPLSYDDVPPSNTTLRAKGPLYVGDKTFQVAPTGFTAIPNPFASPINFATITRTSVQNNFYVWDPKMGGLNGVGAYVLLSFNGSSYDVIPASISPMSQYIQSGQGFLVRPEVSGTPGSITIKESDKSATPAMDVFRTEGPTVNRIQTPVFADPTSGQGLRVTLKELNAGGYASVLDEVFSSYEKVYSEKLDLLDAVKLENVQENLGMVREGQVLMVERKPLPQEGDVIALKLWNTAPKSYVLEVNPVHLGGTGLTAFVEDKYRKTSTPVSLDAKSQLSFTVTADPASARSDRFRIVLTRKAVDGITSLAEKSQITAYPNPVTGQTINLVFTNQKQGLYQVMITNNAGQTILRVNVQHPGGTAAQALRLPPKLAKGVYRVTVSNEAGATTALSLTNQ